ncbi:MAG: hypothetical protein LBN02_09565 [Oscillospiraceae bacterium]|jgi:stage IV sporulation protein FB|nr:hypothetical protein [Oscillospiraceae bacterium]
MSRIIAKIDPSPTAILMPAAMILLDAWQLLVVTVVAAAFHEIGHYAALRVSRGELKRFKLDLIGCSIQYGGNMSYGGEIFTALAGPLMSAVLAVAAALLGRLTGCAPLYQLAGVSGALCVFNLLPCFPLDGGRAVYKICAYVWGLDVAARVTFALRCAVAVSLALLGVWAVLQPPHNPSLLICAATVIIIKS